MAALNTQYLFTYPITSTDRYNQKVGIYNNFKQLGVPQKYHVPGFLQFQEPTESSTGVCSIHLSIDTNIHKTDDVMAILSLLGLPIIQRIVPKTKRTMLTTHTNQWCLPYIRRSFYTAHMYRIYIPIQRENTRPTVPKTNLTRIQKIEAEPLDRNLTRIYIENMDGYAVDDMVILENIDTEQFDSTISFRVADVNKAEGYINIEQRIQEDFSITVEESVPIDCSNGTIYIDYYSEEQDQADIISLHTTQTTDVILCGFLAEKKIPQRYYENDIFSMYIIIQGTCDILMNPEDIALFCPGDKVYLHILHAVNDNNIVFGPHHHAYNELRYSPRANNTNALRSLCVGTFIVEHSYLDGYRIARITRTTYNSSHIATN